MKTFAEQQHQGPAFGGTRSLAMKGSGNRTVKTMLLHMLLLAILTPSAALADPNIQLHMTVAKQVELTQNGHKVTHWVEASNAQPGEKLRYTVHYANVGDQPATDVKIENPVPKLTVYVADSATGKGSKIVFSADGGKTYAPKGKVMYEAALFGGGKQKRMAGPDQYTDIRWLIDRIPPGGTGDVSFIVTVK